VKVEQVSEHIYSLRSWMLFPVHVWVVVADDGVTLVDAGFSFMAKGILQFIDRLNAGPLRSILLTHGHADHVGSVNKIVQSREVPVYAHRKELPYMNGELPYPHRRKPEHNIARGLAQPLVENETGNLVKVAGLQPYFTPGHSPGHVVYYHEADDVLLAGDLFNSKNGNIRRPMYSSHCTCPESKQWTQYRESNTVGRSYTPITLTRL
jgi:glyoxylase-like metal-dependent hydrolase (beta-lactamase superfamily II)